MYLYVIRHGQTDWNIQKKLLSRQNLDLNETGVKQCIEAEKLVKNLNYDLVICSPMTRTKHTANIVNSKNVPVIYDDRLKERDARNIEGIDVDTIDYKAFWTYGKDSIFPSETIEECKNRVYELIEEIKDIYSDKNVLIVTHNGICRMFYTYFNGMPKKGYLFDKGQDNAQIRMYELK